LNGHQRSFAQCCTQEGQCTRIWSSSRRDNSRIAQPFKAFQGWVPRFHDCMSPEGTAECVHVLLRTFGIEVSRPFGTERVFRSSYPILRGGTRLLSCFPSREPLRIAVHRRSPGGIGLESPRSGPEAIDESRSPLGDGDRFRFVARRPASAGAVRYARDGGIGG